MKKIIALSAVAISMTAGACAFADDANPTMDQAAISGVYVGAGLGFGGMDTPRKNLTNNAGSASYKIRRGMSYRFEGGYLRAMSGNFLLGGELGYTGYPRNKYNAGNNSLRYSGYLVDLLAVGKYYFGTSNVNLIGKAGMAYTWQRAKASTTYANNAGMGNDPSPTKDHLLPELAVGVGYDFNPNIGVNLTFAHAFGKQPQVNFDNSTPGLSGVSKVASINTLLLGADYKFAV